MNSNTSPIAISQCSFPSIIVPDSVKETEEYGLQVGKSIQYEWFFRDGTTCRFYNQWIEFHELRLYARGEQSNAKYKTLMATNGDLSHLNLDWANVQIMPKFIDIVVNGNQDRLYEVKCEALDIMSMEKKNKYQEMVELNMYGKPALSAIKDNFGVNGFDMPENEIPQNANELKLHMQMKYKPSIEIAEEVGITTIMLQNNYDQIIRKQVLYDITTIGIGACKHEFNINSGVELSYVDPANLVYSYTESPIFKDVFYYGEVKPNVPLTEILKIKPDITDEEVERISSVGSSWYQYYGVMQPYWNSLFNRDTCTLMYFNYKTSKKEVYKKKKLDNGMEKVIPKSGEFNPEPNEHFEKLERRIDVWYEGVMVLGTEIILKWELSKNMVRPKSATQNAMPNYIVSAPQMYKGQISSLGKRMKPFADLIQMTHLKLQQVLSRIVPDGVYIDVNGISGVDLGTGGTYNPQDALDLFFATGSVIGSSSTMEGDFNHSKMPIQELGTNSGIGKINSLITAYNHYLNMIRDVTGLNEARDASTPDKGSLVGLQKLAAANSNTATRHILQSSLFITKQLAECISCRIADILEYAPFKDEFAMQIGKYNVATLDEIKELYLYNFGIFINVEPDEEEKAKLEENISIALRAGTIKLEDVIDIRETGNIKTANEILKLKTVEREKEMQLQKQNEINMQTQGNIQSAQASSQSQMAVVQAEGQIKLQLAQQEAQNIKLKLELDGQIQSKLMEQKFQYDMQLAGMSNQLVNSRDKQKEDAKDNRTKLQATQQSQLIEQRKNDTPPVDFENGAPIDQFSLENISELPTNS